MIPTSSKSSRRASTKTRPCCCVPTASATCWRRRSSSAPCGSARAIPGVVAQALIDAANDAGGTDNVTAVYVEGPRFAAAGGGTAPREGTRRGSRVRLVSGRVTWLTLGILLGFGIGLGIPFLTGVRHPLLPRRARTLVVGGTGSDRFSTIGAALRVARPGDVVQLEPGAYAEALVLPDGVDLVAREPGTAVLVAPPGAPGMGRPDHQRRPGQPRVRPAGARPARRSNDGGRAARRPQRRHR